MPPREKIDYFDFEPGRILLRKYEILQKLGEGWEGEVYLLKELGTGIERAGKFFFPQRNVKNLAIQYYAKKLHKLRHCPIIIQYYTQETILVRKAPVTFLVSEFVEGELLEGYLKRQRGKRLRPFRALHLLHSLASGMEQVHSLGEYHGDLHSENIIVRQFGLGFEIKLIDLFQWKSYPKPQNIRDDVCDMVRTLYDILGGPKTYPSQPKQVKEICCGLKRSLIWKKFRTAGQLRDYLENLEWD